MGHLWATVGTKSVAGGVEIAETTTRFTMLGNLRYAHQVIWDTHIMAQTVQRRQGRGGDAQRRNQWNQEHKMLRCLSIWKTLGMTKPRASG
ncbi:MAG: hypothetical protein HUU55_11610 [Myxococcales bacterium]|nr:hypothetical protein [Myxococcales bacterium]